MIDEQTKAEIKNAVILENLVKSQENLTQELKLTNTRIQELSEAMLKQKLLEADIQNLAKRVGTLENGRLFVISLIFTALIGAILKLVFHV